MTLILREKLFKSNRKRVFTRTNANEYNNNTSCLKLIYYLILAASLLEVSIKPFYKNDDTKSNSFRKSHKGSQKPYYIERDAAV